MATSKKKKAAPKKKKPVKKRTPTQLKQMAKRGPLPTGEVKPHPYAGLYGNRNAVGNKGRPPAYETPEEMQQQVDAYFEWIKGEKGIEKVKYKDPKTRKEVEVDREYWIRQQEPATATGLILFLGFGSANWADVYMLKTDTEFPNVITRARLKIAQSYEIALHDRDRVNGAKFALPNVAKDMWSNTQQVQPLGADGKPVNPPPTTVIQVGAIAENLGKV